MLLERTKVTFTGFTLVLVKLQVVWVGVPVTQAWSWGGNPVVLLTRIPKPAGRLLLTETSVALPMLIPVRSWAPLFGTLAWFWINLR